MAGGHRCWCHLSADLKHPGPVHTGLQQYLVIFALPCSVLYCPALCCPTEAEFALWLEAIAAGGTYEQLREALQLMAHELNQLKPRTLALVQRFFE